MYEKSLNNAEWVLSSHKESLLTVRNVWEEVVKRSKAEGFEVASLADFSAMLDGDKRFQIVPAQKKSEESEDVVLADADLENMELGQLGFFPEDRVRLRNRPVPPPEPSEAEEEVGSIRRRAFVSTPLKVLSNDTSKKNPAIAKKRVKKSSPKKSAAKQKAAKRPVKSKKTAGSKSKSKPKKTNRKK